MHSKSNPQEGTAARQDASKQVPDPPRDLDLGGGQLREGTLNRQKGGSSGAGPYSSSFLAAAHEAGLIGGRGSAGAAGLQTRGGEENSRQGEVLVEPQVVEPCAPRTNVAAPLAT